MSIALSLLAAAAAFLVARDAGLMMRPDPLLAAAGKEAEECNLVCFLFSLSLPSFVALHLLAFLSRLAAQRTLASAHSHTLAPGRRVIICGASKGIGRDLALLHAQRGDEVRLLFSCLPPLFFSLQTAVCFIEKRMLPLAKRCNSNGRRGAAPPSISVASRFTCSPHSTSSILSPPLPQTRSSVVPVAAKRARHSPIPLLYSSLSFPVATSVDVSSTQQSSSAPSPDATPPQRAGISHCARRGGAAGHCTASQGGRRQGGLPPFLGRTACTTLHSSPVSLASSPPPPPPSPLPQRTPTSSPATLPIRATQRLSLTLRWKRWAALTFCT